GRRPVSAALGELVEQGPNFTSFAGLSFVKWGLAGCGRVPNWPSLLADRTRAIGNDSKVVHVAYADWQCAHAPPLQDVVDLACRAPGNVLLLDTYCKSPSHITPDRRPTLLDWLSVDEVLHVRQRCHEAQVRVALAGSIGIREIIQLRPTSPNWYAV